MLNSINFLHLFGAHISRLIYAKAVPSHRRLICLVRRLRLVTEDWRPACKHFDRHQSAWCEFCILFSSFIPFICKWAFATVFTRVFFFIRQRIFSFCRSVRNQQHRFSQFHFDSLIVSFIHTVCDSRCLRRVGCHVCWSSLCVGLTQMKQFGPTASGGMSVDSNIIFLRILDLYSHCCFFAAVPDDFFFYLLSFRILEYFYALDVCVCVWIHYEGACLLI